MKKRIVIVFAIILAICMLTLTLFGCGESGDVHSHVFNRKVVLKEYLASSASCEREAEYFYSCECGEVGDVTFKYGEALGHEYGEYVSLNNGQHKRVCVKDDEHVSIENCILINGACEMCGYEGSNELSQGKVIVNFGDSIFGKARAPIDISTKLAEETQATVYNAGFGGCRMAKHTIENFDAFSMYQLAKAIASKDFSLQEAAIEKGKIAQTERQGKLPTYFEETLALLKSIDFSKVDIITIAYGTNDFTGNMPIGNEANSYDTETYAGALRYSIETLLTAFPNINIFICSQTYRFWMDESGEFIEDSDTKTNYHGYKLPDYVAKTQEIANEYKLPYIDVYYSLGINKFNRDIYFPNNDGTHHNEKGRERIALKIAKELY